MQPGTVIGMNVLPGSRTSTTGGRGPHVVVGYDDSSTSGATVEWAAREAEARSATLRIVACLAVPHAVDYYGIGDRQRVRLGNVAAGIRAGHPSLMVDEVSTHLDPQDALLAEAVGAEVLVVGGSGSVLAKRRLIGSVPAVAARRSSCPVVVVRRSEQPTLDHVVVGVDGSRAAASALDWAIDEAGRHHAALTIVHACAGRSGRRWTRVDDLEGVDAQCIVDLAVGRAEQRSGCVRVDGLVIPGRPADVLSRAAAEGLLVVGSRGRSGFATMLFGSVTLSVVELARVPVAVIHPRPGAATIGTHVGTGDPRHVAG